MTATAKYSDYLILRASGEWEAFKVPRFIDAQEVAKHNAHSVVCMFLRPKWMTYGTETFHGPCWLVWSREKQEWAGKFRDVRDETEVGQVTLYRIGC